MHTITKISVAAIALLAASPAMAACPNGQFEFFTAGTDPISGDPVAVSNCRKTADHGGDVAWTGNPSTHLTPVLVDHDSDLTTPDVPLVIDGKPIVNGNPSDWSEHHHTKPIVKGYNGVAIGDGAMVGEVVTFTNDNGTPDDTSDDFEDRKIVFANNSTAVGANAKVTHHNSTALGSGAKSTDDHQVTLGTKDETIRAPGIASDKSRNRQQGPVEVVTSDSGGRLATDGGEIFGRLGSLEGGASAHSALLSQHSATLAAHSDKLEDHAKGLAIAMAMPDAWLSDKKRFGIFGAVGGFDNETALGFAAIGRIDETWSLNAKFGGDTEFKQFGWQAGFGAQW
jgi:hypothetical protein